MHAPTHRLLLWISIQVSHCIRKKLIGLLRLVRILSELYRIERNYYYTFYLFSFASLISGRDTATWILFFILHRFKIYKAQLTPSVLAPLKSPASVSLKLGIYAVISFPNPLLWLLYKIICIFKFRHLQAIALSPPYTLWFFDHAFQLLVFFFFFFFFFVFSFFFFWFFLFCVVLFFFPL